jgi:hypothetical protein
MVLSERFSRLPHRSRQWLEITRSVSGSVSGRASGELIQAVALSGPFSANLTLTTHGTKQQVLIRIQGQELAAAA